MQAKNPFGLPGKPEKPEVSNVQKNELLLTWTRPSGGGEVDNYVVEKKSRSTSKWAQVTQVTACKARIVNLIEGNEYQFRVSYFFTTKSFVHG